MPRAGRDGARHEFVEDCERDLAERRGQRAVLWGRDHECERRGWVWVLVRYALKMLEEMGAMLTRSSFWSYEWTKQAWTSPDDSDREAAMKVLLCGGLAGIVTWASIFPLDVIKTRVQTQTMRQERGLQGERSELLQSGASQKSMSAIEVAKHAYRTEGAGVFFRGLGICSVRAFVVNAVQWAVYEWMMRVLQEP